MNEKINSFSVLTEQEAQKVRSTVCELKEFWIERNPDMPFYTLGAASYIDAAKDRQDYCCMAKNYNAILRDRLGWLYERLADKLAQFLKAPVSYRHELALPGFHVYLACKLFERAIASIHCDSQYNLVNWESPDETDFNNPISFTLAISLPKFGGGLNVWNLHYPEIIQISDADFVQLVKSRIKSYYPYQIGQIILHSGHTVHQIAPAKNIQPDDERITLQGHALFSQGRWQIYW
ncbi:hypothetical protein [Microcoleus sp. BROC3]|uniref:hypothetical protein n=1 Tax=Microcoleus sp. BROC3 TaxID=3055323 RepID=UPI002FD74C41